MNELICGTRGSELALTQTNLVLKELSNHSSSKITIKKIKTTGDKRQSRERISSDDKKDWIIELEQQLLSKEIDFAIHSAKDVPIDIETDTKVISVLNRANPKDAFIFSRELKGSNLKTLPKGARIGTSSLRRSSQLLSIRNDLEIIPIRGNVKTRISKIESENLDAVILANAGLLRLDIKTDCLVDEVIPAMCQGTLCVQFLKERKDLEELFSKIRIDKVEASFLFEREIVKELNADCSSALGVYLDNKNYIIRVINFKENTFKDFSGVFSSDSDIRSICKEIVKVAKASWS